MASAPLPKKLTLKSASKRLALEYEHGNFELSAEFLRVHSPSAEVRGHGVGNETLQTGKAEVTIEGIEPVGNYGIKIVFDDGHDSGIYTWPLLHDFCNQQQSMWQEYLSALAQAGASRDA